MTERGTRVRTLVSSGRKRTSWRSLSDSVFTGQRQTPHEAAATGLVGSETNNPSTSTTPIARRVTFIKRVPRREIGCIVLGAVYQALSKHIGLQTQPRIYGPATERCGSKPASLDEVSRIARSNRSLTTSSVSAIEISWARTAPSGRAGHDRRSSVSAFLRPRQHVTHACEHSGAQRGQVVPELAIFVYQVGHGPLSWANQTPKDSPHGRRFLFVRQT